MHRNALRPRDPSRCLLLRSTEYVGRWAALRPAGGWTLHRSCPPPPLRRCNARVRGEGVFALGPRVARWRCCKQFQMGTRSPSSVAGASKKGLARRGRPRARCRLPAESVGPAREQKGRPAKAARRRSSLAHIVIFFSIAQSPRFNSRTADRPDEQAARKCQCQTVPAC